MKRFEYSCSKLLNSGVKVENIESFLNNHGSEGWELCGVEYGFFIFFFIFKRELSEDNLPEDNFKPKSLEGDPIAKTLADLITPKQLVAIRAIANANKINPENECQTQLGCRPEELSRKAASHFIDHLKSLASNRLAEL